MSGDLGRPRFTSTWLYRGAVGYQIGAALGWIVGSWRQEHPDTVHGFWVTWTVSVAILGAAYVDSLRNK